jgi:hypothetical protein
MKHEQAAYEEAERQTKEEPKNMDGNKQHRVGLEAELKSLQFHKDSLLIVANRKYQIEIAKRHPITADKSTSLAAVMPSAMPIPEESVLVSFPYMDTEEIKNLDR